MTRPLYVPVRVFYARGASSPGRAAAEWLLDQDIPPEEVAEMMGFDGVKSARKAGVLPSSL